MSETLRLYHFMRTEHALQAVERRRLKFSDLDKVNDPYDTLSIKFNDPDEEEKFLKTYKVLTEITNVISLSETYRNPALWGHYADRCEGICLGFDVQRDDGPTNKAAKRVQYVKFRLDISDVGIRFADDRAVPRDDVATLDERSQSRLFLKILLTKSCDWAYEKEWRICKERKKPDPVTGLYFCPFGDLLNLREILIGFRCSNKADIKSRLDKLVAGYSPKPEIFFTRRSLSTFEIERVPF